MSPFLWITLRVYDRQGERIAQPASFWQDANKSVQLEEEPLLFDEHGDGNDWYHQPIVDHVLTQLPEFSKKWPDCIIEFTIEDNDTHEQTVVYFHRGEMQDGHWRIVVDPPRWLDK